MHQRGMNGGKIEDRAQTSKIRVLENQLEKGPDILLACNRRWESSAHAAILATLRKALISTSGCLVTRSMHWFVKGCLVCSSR